MAIKNIVFDFGDVFIDLDKTFLPLAFEKYKLSDDIIQRIDRLNKTYEIGAITSHDFLQQLKEYLPELSTSQLIDLWNGMLQGFPTYRLEFLKELKESGIYQLFLLSNTNDLHISNVKRVMPDTYKQFFECFQVVYLSHEIGLRKPNADVFEFVLNNNDLKAHETLFIDDTIENVEGAAACGIHGWHLKVGEQDVIQLNEVVAAI